MALLLYLRKFTYRRTAPADVSVTSVKQEQNVFQVLLWLMVGVGIFLRLFHYIDNRSIWNDEVYLVTSFITMDFKALATEQLAFQQKAPLGFLWLVKLMTIMFGEGEKALRLIPFISGIAALFVFVPVARYFLKPLGAFLAMAVLASSPMLVYHAVEIKQYSSEMLGTILSLYLYTRYHQKTDTRPMLMWGFWGALILWFSFSSIFILAGIAIAISALNLLNKDWQAFFRSIIPFSLWLLSFAVCYFAFISIHAEEPWLVEWFRRNDGFLPANATIRQTARWLVRSIYMFLDVPLGILWNAHKIHTMENPVLRILLKMPVFMFLFWGVGYFALFKTSKRNFWVLVLPFVLTLTATFIEKYPFFDRLLVFLAPVAILVIAYGCQLVTSYLPAAFGKWRYLLPFILIFWPMFRSARQVNDTTLFADGKKSYYREGFQFLKENMQEGDLVYLYWNVSHAYAYYNDIYDMNLGAIQMPDLRYESKDAQDYLRNLRPSYEQAIGKQRVWFIYDPWLSMQIGDYHDDNPWYRDDEAVKCGRLITSDLAAMGEEIQCLERDDIILRLYDLSEAK